MRSAISSTRVSMVMPPSERQRVAEDAGAGQAAGQGADEVEGVDLDAFAVVALAELAAGGTFEHELERLAVDRCPLRDDVADEAAVVVGGEVHRPVGGRVDVDAMGPDVTGEADVEQVLERRPTDGRTEGERQVPSRGRGAPPAFDCSRAHGLELRDELVVRQVISLADLELVQAV